VITGVDPLDDVDGFLATMERYAAVGIEKVWVGPTADPAGWTARVAAEVRPRLAEV